MDTNQTRFDARISKEQKDLFQQAADLGGFRSLTDFVIYSAKAQAELIVRKHEAFLASKRDAQIFFDAITNPPVANARLRKAARKYSQSVAKK